MQGEADLAAFLQDAQPMNVELAAQITKQIQAQRDKINDLVARI